MAWGTLQYAQDQQTIIYSQKGKSDGGLTACSSTYQESFAFPIDVNKS
jgi:hypothetical protein